MRAYSDTYVLGAQRRLGAMLDFAVNGCGLELAGFYGRFLASGLAARFGCGEPGLVAGRSGIELAMMVMAPGDGEGPAGCPRGTCAGAVSQTGDGLLREARAFSPIGGATPEYWTGWAVAYYQWACGRSLSGIDRRVGIDRVRGLYHPFHEMDITRFCDQMDAMADEAHPASALKARREAACLSQSQLARAAGIPVRTLQQYEQRRKDIDKAQAACVASLARALHCGIEDLLEYPTEPPAAYEYAVVAI